MAQRLRTVDLRDASRLWMRMGLLSFGGPAGQIALLHRELVEHQRWLSERRFLHALNFCMLLPGPEATQLATYLGWLMHGVPGGLIAGGLFLAPSVLVLLALSSLYAIWGQLPWLAAIFAMLKPAVLAIVLVAAWRVGQRTLRGPLLTGLAIAAFLALAVGHVPYPLVVLGAGLSGLIAGRWRPALLEHRPKRVAVEGNNGDATDAIGSAIHDDHTPTPPHAAISQRKLTLTLLAWASALLLPLGALVLLGGWNGILAQMARFFTRVAMLSFGGAYAVLPYVAQGAVQHFGWLSAAEMVDGLALGETTPGPLIMVVAFVGFMGGWHSPLMGGPGSWLAAVTCLLTSVWFTFLPSFGFILIGAPLVEASRDDLRLGAPLTAISAAVVGVIASLAVVFAEPVLWPGGGFQPASALVVVLALVAQLRMNWGVLPVIGAASAAGLLQHLLSRLLG